VLTKKKPTGSRRQLRILRRISPLNRRCRMGDSERLRSQKNESPYINCYGIHGKVPAVSTHFSESWVVVVDSDR
jgi:hypothetical protein